MSRPLDRVDVNAARIRRTVARSASVIASAKADLDKHQRWLHDHRLRWSEDLNAYERLFNRHRVVSSCKQIALSLILFVPSICFALLRKTTWLLGAFFSSGFSWIDAKARRLDLTCMVRFYPGG